MTTYEPAGRPPLINLHNHTIWSDGRYSPDLLVKAAAVHRLTHVGISDHFATAKLGAPQFYVDVDEVAAYAADVRRTAEEYAQYVQVLAGLEVDWSPRAVSRVPALLPALGQLDYVLFEYVQDAEWAGESLEALLAILPQVPIPAGLAHNDLAKNMGQQYAPEELVHTLEASGLFVELSTQPGMAWYVDSEPYTVRLWRLLAESSVLFSIGSDTHNAIDDVAQVAGAHRFLGDRGLLGRLITSHWDPVTRTWSDGS